MEVSVQFCKQSALGSQQSEQSTVGIIEIRNKPRAETKQSREKMNQKPRAQHNSNIKFLNAGEKWPESDHPHIYPHADRLQPETIVVDRANELIMQRTSSPLLTNGTQ